MSEQGWILDVFSLEIRQDNVEKVSFCAERPLDTNFVNFGGPRSSVGEVLGASGGGDPSKAVQAKGGGSPGAGL